MSQTHLTRISLNKKTGPIPVSTTSAKTCPKSCPFNHANKGGCYAEQGPLKFHWQRVTREEAGADFDSFLAEIRKLPKGQLWRHNQAGDLQGIGDKLDAKALTRLVNANKGKNGFTYTHKPMDSVAARKAVYSANRAGFTINLSANNLEHADRLAALNIGPVVTVLPANQMRATRTPQGRHVAICPATLSDNVNCANCGICADPNRKAIIGFPAHGNGKRKANAIAQGELA